MVAEQVHRRERLRLFLRQNAARFEGKVRGRLSQPRPQFALRRLRAFGGDAVDIAVGFVELAHDAVVIHRIGIARQHRKHFAEAGLLAVQFVDQPVGDCLFAHQAGGALLDGVGCCGRPPARPPAAGRSPGRSRPVSTRKMFWWVIRRGASRFQYGGKAGVGDGGWGNSWCASRRCCWSFSRRA